MYCKAQKTCITYNPTALCTIVPPHKTQFSPTERTTQATLIVCLAILTLRSCVLWLRNQLSHQIVAELASGILPTPQIYFAQNEVRNKWHSLVARLVGPIRGAQDMMAVSNQRSFFRDS